MFTSRLLPQVADALPSALALRQGNEIVRYGDLCDRASRLARAFQDRGIRSGDRIALLGHPCIDLVIAEHAAIALGAIPFGIFPTLAPPEVQRIVDDGSPAVLVFEAAFAPMVEALTLARRPLEIVSGVDGGRHPSVAELVHRGGPLEHWFQSSPADIAIIVYTGGTSGQPKGVVHTYGSMASWANMRHPGGPGYSPGQRSIVFNLAHMSGQGNLWKTVAAGGELMFLPSYPPSPAEIVDLIERERVSNFSAVGLLRQILALDGIEQRDLRSLKVVVGGGAPISPQVLQRAAEVFPTAIIVVAYGLTESGHAISAVSINDVLDSGRLDRLRSVGRSEMSLLRQQPFSIRIVDEAGRDVGPGEVGEIAVCGPQVMAGYWNNADATRDVLKDGWLFTGDLGRLDESGFLSLVDRKKDVIIASNGVCVYPSEIEEVVARHPSILDAAIVGLSTPDDLEEITAIVVLRPGTTLTLSQLRQFCASDIGSFKLPVRLVIVDALPRTAMGKVARTRLRDLCVPSSTIALDHA